MDDKVPMWHQKNGIGKMYNIIEDNVTWRSTNYIRNVTTNYKIIEDQQWHSRAELHSNLKEKPMKWIVTKYRILHSNNVILK